MISVHLPRHAVRGAALAIALAAPAARADILPTGAKGIAYTYEIDNLGAHPGFTFVVWPRTCGSGGEPVGSIHYTDESKPLAHTVDYEVLAPGPHELLKYCAAAARVYALDAKDFPTDSRVAANDDWMLSWSQGKPYAGVGAIDAMTLRDRVPFFAQARKATFAIPYLHLLRRASPIKAIHDVLTVRALDGARFEIGPVKVRYELEGSASEEVAWAAGDRPPPTGKPKALEWPPPFGSAAEDANADATVLAPEAPAATRMPWRAVLVIAGVGAIAVLAMRWKRRS